jgi:hypothetical protein
MKFWLHKPDILIHRDYLRELWPTVDMSVNQKLNAITRFIILITLLGCFFMENIAKLIITTVVTLLAIVMYQRYMEKRQLLEGLDNPEGEKGEEGGEVKEENKPKLPLTEENYTLPTKQNPFMNVSLPELPGCNDVDVSRNQAAPSYNPDISKKISTFTGDNTMRTKDKLFLNTSEQQHLRHYTNPSTTIPNDQQAYLDFIYGNTAYQKDQLQERYKENKEYLPKE